MPLTNPNAFSAGGGSSIFQTLSFSNANGVSFTNTNGQVAGSVAAQSAQTLSFVATSNTTQNSTTTLDARSITIQGAGILSAGFSNGSIVLSVPAGGGGGDGGVFAGVSNLGNTAGSTGTVSTGNFVLVGSNGITLSQSTGAAGSAATVTIQGNPNLSGWKPYHNAVWVLGADSNQSLLVAPMEIPRDVQYDRVVLPIFYSQATNSTLTISRSVFWGWFTKSGSTLSLHYSGSGSYSINGSGTASSSANSGIRVVSFGQTTTLTQGNYYLGMVFRSSTAGANATLTIMVASRVASTISGYIGSGSATNVQFEQGQGVWTSTTSGIPSSLAFSDIRANSSAFQRPPIMLVTSQWTT